MAHNYTMNLDYYRIPRWRKIISSLILGIFFSGCSLWQPLKGYDGPDRPRSEISLIHLPEKTTKTKSWSKVRPQANIDSNSVPEEGIFLAPGRHVFTFSYYELGGAAACETEFNGIYMILDDILTKAIQNKQGDYQYTEICNYVIRPVSCSGIFSTIAGQDYTIEFNGQMVLPPSATTQSVDLFTFPNSNSGAQIGSCNFGDFESYSTEEHYP